MDTLGAEYVAADQLAQWLQDGRAGADMVGQGRDIEVDALTGIAFALTIERLMRIPLVRAALCGDGG